MRKDVQMASQLCQRLALVEKSVNNTLVTGDPEFVRYRTKGIQILTC